MESRALTCQQQVACGHADAHRTQLAVCILPPGTKQIATWFGQAPEPLSYRKGGAFLMVLGVQKHVDVF